MARASERNMLWNLLNMSHVPVPHKCFMYLKNCNDTDWLANLLQSDIYCKTLNL